MEQIPALLILLNLGTTSTILIFHLRQKECRLIFYSFYKEE